MAAQSWISQAIGGHEHGWVQGALTSIGSLAEAAMFAWSVTMHAPGPVFLLGAAFLLVATLLAAKGVTPYARASIELLF